MDHERILKGYAFDPRNIWTPQDFEIKLDPESLFQLPTLDGLELDDLDKGCQQEFQIPELGTNSDPAQHELEAVDSDIATLDTSSNDFGNRDDATPADVWTLDLELDKDSNVAPLRTWEVFEKKDVPNSENVAYLSEAGPGAFDAVLASIQPKEIVKGVLPQDVMLEALYNLALGRSSIFFQWDASKQTFSPTLEDVPISGYSLASYSTFVAKMIDCGSRFRMMSEYVALIWSSKRSCTAIVALKGCIKSLLDSIERHLVKRKSHLRSLLQLQRVVELPHHLLTVLKRLTDSIEGLFVDEAVISALSDKVHEIVGSENVFAAVLREILARVSTPWLERLCTDLGLRGARMDQSPVECESIAEEPIDELDVSSSERPSSLRKLPEFFSTKDRELIRETKKSVRLLRQYLPEYQTEIDQVPDIPQSILHVARPAPGLRDSVNMDMRRLPSDGTRYNSSGLDRTTSDALAFSGSSGWCENLAWAEHDTQQDYLTTLDAHMSKPLDAGDLDPVCLMASSVFENSQPEATSDSNKLSAEFDFNPLDRLRPVIQSHSTRVNKTLLRHLFWRHRLRHHLDLQRQFHLLGNDDFVSRLAKALFSTETQSAERKRGRIPTGETMGLRLNTKMGQRWPPASSEVQLTLMGILTETYHPDAPQQVGRPNTKELPGGLSFSIRELPEGEIEKVMDSGSIYALDFLKLQYTAPPTLDAIMTNSAMKAYDDIFRFLLKFLRVLHVTTRLREIAAIDTKESDRFQDGTDFSKSSTLFAFEAHQCITVLMSHFMDVGIAAPWNKFLSSLRAIEDALKPDLDSTTSGTDRIMSLDGLREMHESCLESVRSRLFLRRKQQKLRDAVEQVLTSVLSCASCLESEDCSGEQVDFGTFQDALKGLLNLLRAAVDKPLKGNKADETVEEEGVEAMKILMLRLDWNGFYGTVEEH